MIKVNYKDHLEINPDVRFGKPVVKGTRISVYDVLSWLAADMSMEEIMEDFPQLKRVDILACLVFSADKIRLKE